MLDITVLWSNYITSKIIYLITGWFQFTPINTTFVYASQNFGSTSGIQLTLMRRKS